MRSTPVQRALAAALLAAVAASWPVPAWSLSEIQREDLPAPQQPGSTDPAKAPAAQPEAPGGESPDGDTAQPGDEAPAQEGDAQAQPDDETAVPEVSYDLAALPEPVRRMHGLLLEACRSADIEKLRPLLGNGDDATQISLGEVEGDVIDFLKQSSGDGQGLEILAILEEVLSAGYVHADSGQPEELYVWPYFFAVPLDKLTNRQQVELYKIVTSSDVEEMKTFGAYIFYRVGITPEGRWAFFVAGD
jgi:hypothetical protein